MRRVGLLWLLISMPLINGMFSDEGILYSEIDNERHAVAGLRARMEKGKAPSEATQQELRDRVARLAQLEKAAADIAVARAEACVRLEREAAAKAAQSSCSVQ